MLLHVLLLLTTASSGAEVVVSLTPRSMSHLFKRETAALHESLLHLRPAPFRATYLGLEVTIDHLQVVDLKMPKLSYETTSSPSQLTFKLLGGSARVLGQYSAVYKTKREGQFELILDHFHLTVPVQRIGVTKFSPSADKCSLQVDESTVSLSPQLPEQIAAKIRGDILEQLRHAACFQSLAFFSKLNGQLAHFAEATDISQGGHPSHIDVDVRLQDSTTEDDTSVHVQVSESVVNAELSKLYSSANTRFLWNEVPEIKKLLEECETPECRSIQDGDLISSLFERPSIKINSDESVSLRLPLSTTLTTSASRELFRIQSDVYLILEDILVEQPENGLISWSAKYRVKSIKIMQTASSRTFQKFATTMESWIEQHKGFIENLLNSYLHGSLPVHLRSPLSWSHRLHGRPNFGTSSLNFHVHPHFTPALRVLV